MKEFAIKKYFYEDLNKTKATKVYKLLIKFAKSRKLTFDDYFEIHHIIPKCLGGSDRRSNLIALTCLEHCFAHYLLAIKYPNHRGLNFAFMGMMNKSKMNFNFDDFKNIAELRKNSKKQPHTSDTLKKLWRSSEEYKDGMTYREYQLKVIHPKINKSRAEHFKDDTFKREYIKNSFGNSERQFLNSHCKFQKYILKTFEILITKRLTFNEHNWNENRVSISTPTFICLKFIVI